MIGERDSAGVPGGEHRQSDMADRANAGYSELLARVPAIVYIAEPGGCGPWHYVSPQIEQILGYTPEEWCADPEMWFSRLHPADRDWVLEREEALARADPDTPDLEYRMLHRDGRLVWIRDDAVLASAEHGERWHGVL